MANEFEENLEIDDDVINDEIVVMDGVSIEDTKFSELDKETQRKLIKKSKISRIIYWALQLFTFFTMIASIILYFIKDTGLETTAMHVFMCLVTIVIFNVPQFLEKRLKLYIPGYMQALLYLLIFAHFVLGELYRIYDSSNVFDKLLHTTSGVTIAMVSFSIVSMLNNLPNRKTSLSPFFVVLFSFCFAMTMEYLWEVFEYIVDRFFGGNMQRWQGSIVEFVEGTTQSQTGEFVHNVAAGNGLLDSMGDMVVNIFGALGVCIYGYIGLRLKPDWFRGKVIMKSKDVARINSEILKKAKKKEGKNPLNIESNLQDSSVVANLEYAEIAVTNDMTDEVVIKKEVKKKKTTVKKDEDSM